MSRYYAGFVFITAVIALVLAQLAAPWFVLGAIGGLVGVVFNLGRYEGELGSEKTQRS